MSENELLSSLASPKPVAAACMLALLWTLESLAPMFAGRSGRLRHGGANLALGAFNAALTPLLFAGLMLLVTAWSARASFGLAHWLPLPPWAVWVVVLVLFDGWMYAWHRLNHRVKFLWRFHAVHHADREMDVTSAVRFHTGEIILSSVARLAVLPLLGMTMAMLLVYEAILLPVILFHHSNIRIPGRLDRVLRVVITTPWMHWVHHSEWQPETDSNFSSVLSLWDRIFGTFRLREDPGTIVLGLDDEKPWTGVNGLVFRPFRRVRD